MGAARGALIWLARLAFIGFPCVVHAAQVQPEAARASDVRSRRMHFDIQPQSLVTALSIYSGMTGLAILVDGSMTAGIQSPGVQGDRDADEALRQLLDGTSLEARYVSANAFTLAAIEVGESDGVAPPASASVDGAAAAASVEQALQDYAGGIQASVEHALCRTPETRPGRYRLALRLWIDPAGRVSRTRLLDDGSAKTRDARIVTLLDQLALDAPPADLPQPITLLLLPDAPGNVFDCRSVQPMQH
jgi:hypothetical protein